MTMAQDLAFHKPLNAGEAKDIYRESLCSLRGGQQIDYDLRRELETLARSSIERIMHAHVDDYQKTYNVMVVPEDIYHIVYRRACLTYVRHAACLIKDLKLAASSDMKAFCKPVF